MTSNPIKQLWKEGKTVANLWVSIPSAWTAELMAHTGFDTMTIDAQHGLANDLSTILPMLQAIDGTGTTPFVRLPANDAAFAMRMLDAGVYGLICPMLNNRAETERFVQACLYPPFGNRSFGPTRALVSWGEDYFTHANEQVITMAMIETADALQNLEDIAQTPHLDGLYVGPWDLSLALGMPKMADFESEELLKIFGKIIAVCRKNNIVAGIQCSSPQVARKMAVMGFQFVTLTNDTRLLKVAAQESLAEFRA